MSQKTYSAKSAGTETYVALRHALICTEGLDEATLVRLLDGAKKAQAMYTERPLETGGVRMLDHHEIAQGVTQGFYETLRIRRVVTG